VAVLFDRVEVPDTLAGTLLERQQSRECKNPTMYYPCKRRLLGAAERDFERKESNHSGP
jgi:hypothetical protein